MRSCQPSLWTNITTHHAHAGVVGGRMTTIWCIRRSGRVGFRLPLAYEQLLQLCGRDFVFPNVHDDDGGGSVVLVVFHVCQP